MNIKRILSIVWPALVIAVSFALVNVSDHRAAAACGGVQKTSILNCDQENKDTNNNKKIDINETGVWGLLLTAINILVAGVGVVALGGIVYGAVLYTSAGGNPDQVKKAKTMFMNVAIGVVLFAGMYVLLNFIVPGGVLKR